MKALLAAGAALLLGCGLVLSGAPGVRAGEAAVGMNEPGARVHRDIQYVPNGHERQRLDLYLPVVGQDFPVVVWVHGGAWLGGDKRGLPQRAELLRRGFAVASLGYRLSSHAVFPAQIQDCQAAVRWLRAHAKEYGYNAERIGAWGPSAGGHLVALLGTAGEGKAWEPVGEHQDKSARVQCVVDWFGPTDFLKMDAAGSRQKHDAADSPESRLVGGPIQEHPERVRRANPITYVSRDDPPFLIMHGDQDPLVPFNQSQLLHEALKKAGVAVELHPLPGAGHGGRGFDTPEVRDKVFAFLERHLKS